MSMWGSSITDWAKKAEEAAAASSTSTWATGISFNLDSMQGGAPAGSLPTTTTAIDASVTTSVEPTSSSSQETILPSVVTSSLFSLSSPAAAFSTEQTGFSLTSGIATETTAKTDEAAEIIDRDTTTSEKVDDPSKDGEKGPKDDEGWEEEGEEDGWDDDDFVAVDEDRTKEEAEASRESRDGPTAVEPTPVNEAVVEKAATGSSDDLPTKQSTDAETAADIFVIEETESEDPLVTASEQTEGETSETDPGVNSGGAVPQQQDLASELTRKAPIDNSNTDVSVVAQSAELPPPAEAKSMSSGAEPTTKPLPQLLIVLDAVGDKRQSLEGKVRSLLAGRSVQFELASKHEAETYSIKSSVNGEGSEGVLLYVPSSTGSDMIYWGNLSQLEAIAAEGMTNLSAMLSQPAPQIPKPSVASEKSEAKPVPASVPSSNGANNDALMRQFSEQIRRLEEHHASEVADMERKHAAALQNSSADSKREWEDKVRKLEKEFNVKIKEKDAKLVNVMKANEGHKLKIDVLKREVEGMEQLVQSRDTHLGKTSALHKRDLKILQEQLVEREEKASAATTELQKCKSALDEASTELETLRKEHGELKTRAQNIATELVERRAECRELKSRLDEALEANEGNETALEKLRLQLSSQDFDRTETDEQITVLRSESTALQQRLEETEAAMKAKEQKADKALNDYKKKAQNSLALANSRTAAAVQAKEEAELEARAARSTADTAMERAVKAEISSKEAMAEANAYVLQMEKDKSIAVKEKEKAEKELKGVLESLAAEQKKSVQMENEKLNLNQRVKEANNSCEREIERSRILENRLAIASEENQDLSKNLENLHKQLQTSEAARMELKDDERKRAMNAARRAADQEDAEVTIQKLQQELKESNAVIEDLKDALKNAIEEKTKTENGEGSSPENDHRDRSRDTNDQAPLFYAMEKDAELKTARDEINRLANLLSNIQMERSEAVDAMEEMRKRMEEAEARLKRYDKLSSANEERKEPSAVNGGERNSGATNIEYLKNIMLSYLSAKTIAEKKALVPVIGAVLCLTQDEQRRAMTSLEESATLGGVGNSLFESLTGTFGGK